MIRPICRMGNPVLREKAREISKDDLKTEFFDQLLKDMFDCMKYYGGIGIAAPQIGVPVKVAIIELKGLNRYGEEIDLPLTTIINPTIEYLSSELQGFWEGCLSLPGIRGYVERPSKVKVSFMDEEGELKELIGEGFLATVLQHELDHLDGKLYIDRIKDTRLLSYQEEFDALNQGKDQIE